MTTFEHIFDRAVRSGSAERTLRSIHRRWKSVIVWEDLFQATLLKAWEHQSVFRGATEAEFLAWLRPIARSIAVDELRRKKSAAAHEQQAGAMQHQRKSQNLRAEVLVNWLLADLSPAEREILELLYLERLTADEVAQKLHLTTAAVHQQRYRAIMKIKDSRKKRHHPR